MERFFSKVKKCDSGCWEWTAGSRGNGYGAFKYEGKIVESHRFSYQLHKGYIPNGFFVCHKCDNRKCVNPDHLHLGTPQDNYNDAIRRGAIIKPQPQPQNRIHPSYSAYARGCKCRECMDLHRDAGRAYRAKRK